MAEPRQDDEPCGSGGARENNRGILGTLLRHLHIGGMAEESGEKILDERSIDGIKRYIESGRCKNVIVMAGAGISTAAGIPDFRSPGSGLYDNVTAKYQLPDPQLIFEIGFFRQNPRPFFSLSKELFPEAFDPTLSHHFVKLLHEKGLLLRHYTQNIDGLERKAEVPTEQIVEAHGTFYTSHCIEQSCHTEYSFQWIKEKIMTDEIPVCEKCESLVKPDIVFFGEALPMKFFMCAEQDFDQCDLLIIMGTSLVVQPFASLVDRVPPNCPRLLINREKVGYNNAGLIAALLERFGGDEDIDITSLLLNSRGLNFEDKRNRDVALLGDCDEGVLKLAQALGWSEDLKKIRDKQLDPQKQQDEAQQQQPPPQQPQTLQPSPSSSSSQL